MEILKFLLIALLIGQIFYSGIFPALGGLIGWTIIWVPVALIHNLISSEPWSYLGFWIAVWSWEASEWSDVLHANIGVGLTTIYTLLSTQSHGAKQADEAPEQ
jgi:hypothetical protein